MPPVAGGQWTVDCDGGAGPVERLPKRRQAPLLLKLSSELSAGRRTVESQSSCRCWRKQLANRVESGDEGGRLTAAAEPISGRRRLVTTSRPSTAFTFTTSRPHPIVRLIMARDPQLPASCRLLLPPLSSLDAPSVSPRRLSPALRDDQRSGWKHT